MRNPKKALRLWRERQGLTLEECGKRLGVTGRTVQRWESTVPELNHGTKKVWEVPIFLIRFIERDFQLPPIKE